MCARFVQTNNSVRNEGVATTAVAIGGVFSHQREQQCPAQLARGKREGPPHITGDLRMAALVRAVVIFMEVLSKHVCQDKPRIIPAIPK